MTTFLNIATVKIISASQKKKPIGNSWIISYTETPIWVHTPYKVDS